MPVPYVSPTDLLVLPLGISLRSLGQPAGTQPSSGQNEAAIWDICGLAASMADAEMNQDQRCSYVSEFEYGPGHWVSAPGNGSVRVMVAFNPVSDVPFCAVAPTGQKWPKSWTVAPAGSAWSERHPAGVYGTSAPGPASGGLNSILVAQPCFPVGWGREGTMIALNYAHGWPHAALTAAASQGDTEIQVSETCGFTGANATLRDPPNSEDVFITLATPAAASAWSSALSYFPGMLVTYSGTTWQATLPTGPLSPSGVQTPAQGPYWTSAVYPCGPGTLSLSGALQSAHASGVIVTAVPYAVRWGAALYAKAVLLERGLATIAPGGKDGKPVSTADAIEQSTVSAVAALRPFARVY